jgi:hydroxyacylglutathione hydrolase
MEIHRIPVLRDNYIFVLHDVANQTAAVVDPAVAEPVLSYLNSLGATLMAVLNTHHHADHVGGNQKLLACFPDALVYGGAEDRDRIPGQHIFLQEGDTVTFGGRTAQVLFIPGHTRAHIAYYFPPTVETNWGELFCGDTLFAGGCGRLFEGTPTQMVASLTKVRSLPDTTRIWCAHEYTLNNLRFALTVDNYNPDLQALITTVTAVRRRNEPTIPSELGLEKRTNPFLRWDHSDLQSQANTTDPVTTFAYLRQLKDTF